MSLSSHTNIPANMHRTREMVQHLKVHKNRCVCSRFHRPPSLALFIVHNLNDMFACLFDQKIQIGEKNETIRTTVGWWIEHKIRAVEMLSRSNFLAHFLLISLTASKRCLSHRNHLWTHSTKKNAIHSVTNWMHFSKGSFNVAELCSHNTICLPWDFCCDSFPYDKLA